MQRGDWRATGISEDPADMRVSDDETIGQAVERTAANLRDQTETFSDVVGRYGADAELVGVGFGSTQSLSTVDIYYDNLVVDVAGPGQGQGQGQGQGGGQGSGSGYGGSGDGGSQGDGSPGQQRRHELDFPVVVPMDLSFESGGSGEVTARLEPTQNEQGGNLSHLVTESVRLYAYSEAAPPLEEGVAPVGGSASVSRGGIDATFDTSDVGSLPTLAGSGEQFVLVAGEFDFDQVV